jgi:SAM-dependent methyltransferase
MEKYVEVTYKNKLMTQYPSQLIEHLFINEAGGFLKNYNFNRYGQVLDLGCGRGEFLLAFCEKGFLVEGFDRCPVKHINKTYLITIGDIEKPLPYKNNTFDIVFCKSVIEHLYYPENLFKEVARILKKGGCFIVLTPDWDSTKSTFYKDFTHRTPFTLKSLEDIYDIYGFKNIKCEKFIQLPILWKYNWLLPLCKIASFFYTPNTKNKFIKYSKEKMLLGIGTKNDIFKK